MNNARRKKIADINERLDGISAEIMDLFDEEEEAFMNLPESLQESEKGELMDEKARQLEEAAANVHGIMEELNEVAE